MPLIDPRDDAEWAALDGSAVPGMDLPPGVQGASALPWTSVWEPPGPVADRFFWCDDDVVGIRGPVGSGKTTAHLRSRFRRAINMPISNLDGIRHYKVVIARQTYRQLWQTTIPSWWEVMPKNAPGTRWAGGRGDPVTHTIEFEDEHGPIHFIAEFLAFGESAAEIEANIRGVQTTDLALEEADTVDAAVVTRGVGRIDRYPAKKHFLEGGGRDAYPEAQRSYGQITCSYNAPDEDNWVVRVIEGKGLDDDPKAKALRKELAEQGVLFQFYRQPGFDEPGCENLQHLGPKYYPRQIALMRAEGRGNEVDRLVYNRLGYVRIGDPVFADNFKRNVHRAAATITPVQGVPLRVGLDQGAFGAAVIGQYLGQGRWIVLAELCFAKAVFAPEFGMALRELLAQDRFHGLPVEGAWCDMAGSARESLEDVTWMTEVAKASGLQIEPQNIGANRIAPRLAVWRAAMDFEAFGRQGILIDPSCRLLIRGLENDYVWAQDPDKADSRRMIPKKRGVRAADVIDAGGYMLLSESDMDGTPVQSGLVGHNGGPPLDDAGAASAPVVENYDFDPREDW